MNERGSASLTLLALAGALAAFGLLLALLGGVAVARQRAASAADLAALAAADHALAGSTVACAAAGRIARDGGVELVSCRLEGAEVLVRIRVLPGGLLGALGGITAAARAGPGPVSPPAQP